MRTNFSNEYEVQRGHSDNEKLWMVEDKLTNKAEAIKAARAFLGQYPQFKWRVVAYRTAVSEIIQIKKPTL